MRGHLPRPPTNHPGLGTLTGSHIFDQPGGNDFGHTAEAPAAGTRGRESGTGSIDDTAAGDKDENGSRRNGSHETKEIDSLSTQSVADLMNIKVEVGPIELNTVIGEERIYDDEGYITKPVTLGEAIAKKIFADIRQDEGYGDLKQTVRRIREEEIRNQVRPIIEKAITDPIQKTTSYGEPLGEPTTLSALVIEAANKYLNQRDSSYNAKDSRTTVEKLASAAAEKAINQELSAVISAEKEKVVAVVREKAAELIADAVRQGLRK